MRFSAAYAKLERPLDDWTIPANRIKRRCGSPEAAVKSHTFPGIGLAVNWVYGRRMADVGLDSRPRPDLPARQPPLGTPDRNKGDFNDPTPTPDSCVTSP